MFGFWKIWCALLSCYLRFEIRPFTLLPPISRNSMFSWNLTDFVNYNKPLNLTQNISALLEYYTTLKRSCVWKKEFFPCYYWLYYNFWLSFCLLGKCYAYFLLEVISQFHTNIYKNENRTLQKIIYFVIKYRRNRQVDKEKGSSISNIINWQIHICFKIYTINFTLDTLSQKFLRPVVI